MSRSDKVTMIDLRKGMDMFVSGIRKLSILASLALSVSVVGLNAGSAASYTAPAPQEQEESYAEKAKTRKVPSMSIAVHKKVEKAQKLLEENLIDEANEVLTDLQNSSRINDYELSVIYQLQAQMAYERDDTPGAIEAFKKVLSYKNSIPVQQEIAITFNISQLYYSIDDLDNALEYYNLWEPKAETIGIIQRVYAAQLYYSMENYSQSVVYIKKAIDEASAIDTVEVEERWYGLLLSAYWELNQFSNVRDVLEILIISWPKPRYWEQLAGIYSELGQEQTSFSITEAAYKQGFLDEKPTQLINLAQILMSRQAPVKAAWLLEDAVKNSQIEKNAKNYRTLGQAWMLSAEYDKAVFPLSKAAEGDDSLEANAETWTQVAQVLGQIDRLDDSIKAFDKAISLYEKEKGNKSNKALISIIMQKVTALIELKKFDQGTKALAKASRLASSFGPKERKKQQKTISQWQNYLKSEKEREEKLAELS